MRQEGQGHDLVDVLGAEQVALLRLRAQPTGQAHHRARPHSAQAPRPRPRRWTLPNAAATAVPSVLSFTATQRSLSECSAVQSSTCGRKAWLGYSGKR